MENQITVVVTVPGTMTLDKSAELREDISAAIKTAIDEQEDYDGAEVSAVYLSSR